MRVRTQSAMYIVMYETVSQASYLVVCLVCSPDGCLVRFRNLNLGKFSFRYNLLNIVELIPIFDPASSVF